MHICVCIITYRRPRFLKRLLEHLQEQETEGRFTYSVNVVDNDSERSAFPIVEGARAASKIDIAYDAEPRQNLALARNRALLNARGNFAAFIDDDEFPTARWLLNLQLAMERFQTDGVLGPVEPHFEVEPPEWVQRMKLFRHPHYLTGYSLTWEETRTGNVMLNLRLVEDNTNLFNPAFATHGEDKDFFRRLTERGCKFVWCDEAVVYETQPPERMKRKYQLRRALLRGSISYTHARRKVPAVLTSITAVCLYTAALPLMQLRGHHAFMSYLIRDCDHLGRLLAFAGYKVEEHMKSI